MEPRKMLSERKANLLEGGHSARRLPRLLSALVGVVFIFGPIVSPMVYENQWVEILNAKATTLLIFGFVYLLSAITGGVFVLVAAKGRAPKWLEYSK